MRYAKRFARLFGAFLTLSFFSVSSIAAQNTDNSFIYNELVKTLNEKKIDYAENPLRILSYTKMSVPIGTLLLTTPLRTQIEIDESLPWIHQILIDFIEKIRIKPVDFDIAIIFLDGDFLEQEHAEDFSTNFDIQFLLDTYETDDKVALIDTNFFSLPSKINMQNTKGQRRVPQEIAEAFFSACRTLNISTSIIGRQKSTLFDTLGSAAWDYEFPVISLNGDSRKSLFVPSLNTISKDSMSDLFVLFSKNIMADPSMDYDRHYLLFGFLSFNITVPESIIVAVILLGGTAVFFVFAFLFLYHRK
ncbi:MAG: hypothetical protein Ta2F_04100 [Termitinemataceae bacterium]|nr:MAG: hypothetical protein Ta2F_04100 [Termitinemataceae bacterium]